MYVYILTITIILRIGRLGGVSDIVISEISSDSAALDNQNVFIELHYIDIHRFLMMRNPVTHSGPSLQDHYILIVKPFDNEFGGPIVSTLIDLTKSAFKFDSNFFTIGSHNIGADINFEDSDKVYSIKIAARSEQCEEFVDIGENYPVAVFLLVTQDKKFIQQRLELSARHLYVFITEEIKDFINKTVTDAVVYGRRAEFDRCNIFGEMIDAFKNADHYVLRQFHFPGFVDKSMSKCPNEQGALSLHQPFSPHLFKLRKPTPGCPNDCSGKGFFLEDVFPKIVGNSGLVESDPQIKQTRYYTEKFRASINSNVTSASIIALRDKLFPNDNEDDGKLRAKRPCLVQLEPSECLMQHTRHNKNPTECGQQGTESANLHKLSALNAVLETSEANYGNFKTASEAILARAHGIFDAENHDLEEILVCGKHAQDFSRHWTRLLPKTKRDGENVLTCKFPPVSNAPEPHERPKLATNRLFVSEKVSEALLKLKNVFIPTGWHFLRDVLQEYNSGLQQENEERAEPNQPYFMRPRYAHACKPQSASQNTDNSADGSQPKDNSGSEYVPSQEKMNIDVEEKTNEEHEIEKIQSAVYQLATAARIDMVRFTDNLPRCSSGTQERYTRIARTLSKAVCRAIAPYQSDELSRRLFADSKKLPEPQKDIEKLETLMKAIAHSYHEAKSPAMRNMILSLIAPYSTYNDLVELIPTLSSYKFKTARLYSKMYGPGTQPTEIIRTRRSIPKVKITSFIDFLLSNGISVELPYGEVRVKLSSGQTETIPNLLRVMNDEYTADLYNSTVNEKKERDLEQGEKLELSKSSLLKILKMLKSSHRQQIRAIDYFHSYGSKGFDTLTDIVNKLEENRLVDNDWSTLIKKRLHDFQYFLKAEYRGRILETSQVADFCSTFALSDLNDHVFLINKTTLTRVMSSEGLLLKDTLKDIAETVEEAYSSDEKEKAEALLDVTDAKLNIQEWKAHIVRTYRQNLGRQRVMESLKRHQTIIWIDWAMKWIPERGSEDQSQFFGKAGIPWHVSVAYKRNTDGSGYDARYFVHSFQSTAQDSAAVVGIINDTLTRIKAECGYITQAIIFSDNAGCYKSGNTIAAMSRMKDDTGIAVIRWDFSDAQSGKGPADRFTATAKRKAYIYLAEGKNCDTADAFVTCITSHHGTEGMTAIVSELECDATRGRPSKIEGITKLHNFQFHNNSLLVHRAYDIGRGRIVPLDTLNPNYLKCRLKPIRVVNRDIEESAPLINDTYWKSLVTREPNEADQHMDRVDDSSETSETDIRRLKNNTGLFTCPVPECTKVFQRYKNLQRHLELGNHQFKPETVTTRAFVIREYKDRVEGLQLNRFQEMRAAISDVGSNLTAPQYTVTDGMMEWALPQRKPVTRLSNEIKDYLNEKFNDGIKDPRRGKWKPDALAKAMRKENIFTACDYLSPQQIAAYFSRLAKQREKQPATNPAELFSPGNQEEDDGLSEFELPNEFEEDPSRDTIYKVIKEVIAALRSNNTVF